jgi:hypothetical protein
VPLVGWGVGEQKPLPRQSFTYKNKTGSEGVDPKAHVFAGPRSLSESNPDRKLQFQFVIWSDLFAVNFLKRSGGIWYKRVRKEGRENSAYQSTNPKNGASPSTTFTTTRTQFIYQKTNCVGKSICGWY